MRPFTNQLLSNSLDPWLQSLELTNSISSIPDIKFVSKTKLLNFNPYIGLITSDLPESFYPVLSIYNTLNLVSCNRMSHSEGLSSVSLDSSLGFIMATQCRYPDTLFYSLYRDDWDVARSRVDLSRVSQMFVNLEELRLITMRNNPRGVDIAYCSEPNVTKIELVSSMTKQGGSLIVRMNSLLGEEMADILLTEFSRVVVYKPATSSSVAIDFYLVCTSRSRQSNATLQDRQQQLDSQLKAVEEYRVACLQSVLNEVDNRDKADTHGAKIAYLGLK